MITNPSPKLDPGRTLGSGSSNPNGFDNRPDETNTRISDAIQWFLLEMTGMEIEKSQNEELMGVNA